jgi:hypothetical protein
LALFTGKPSVNRQMAKLIAAGEILLFTPQDLLA